MSHTCHALNCEVNVPPRLHMCKPHWSMVPLKLQRDLWANYRRGQERDMSPSPKYLHAAAACVRAVAEKEGQPPDQIDDECSLYTEWAAMLGDADSAVSGVGSDSTEETP
jgi:diadenosine tetraphosphatase ApaH/serine/threonine PP2A family protein phosphatase